MVFHCATLVYKHHTYLSRIEGFVILMYDGKSYLDDINAAKNEMFTN